MSDNPHDYKTLYEFERREHSTYEAAPVTRDSMRDVLEKMRALLSADPELLLSEALERAGDNVDSGHHFLCLYDLRKELAKRLARHASEINKAGGKATPLATVERALNPPAKPTKPATAMMDA